MLEKPIPAVYTDAAEDPSSQNEVFTTHFLTDENGRVTFDELVISQRGPIGNFTLAFSCQESFQTMIHEIEVISSIVDSKFAQPPPERVTVENKFGSEYELALVIEVNDALEAGVPGKYPTKIYTQTNNTNDQDELEVQIAHFSELFQPSQKDGVMTIPLKVSKLTKDVIANITLTIDSINVTTPLIEFVVSPNINKTSIASSRFTEFPNKIFNKGFEINEKFDISLEFWNIMGEKANLENLKFFLGIYFNPLGQADVPFSFVNITSDQPKVYRNQVSFKNCHFTRAATGHYDIFVFISSTEDSFDNTFASSFLKTKVNYHIDIVQLIKAYPVDQQETDLLEKARSLPIKDGQQEFIDVKLNQKYNIVLLLYNYASGPLRDTKVPFPPVDYEEYPPMMQALGGPQDYIKMTELSSKTDSEGNYVIQFEIKYGGIGGYVVSLDFGTSISIPIPFKTENTLKSIKIEQEPYIYDKSSLPGDEKAAYVGQYFDHKAQVRIDVKEGSKAGYIILAKPVVNFQTTLVACDLIPQSQFEFDHKKENYMGWVTRYKDARYAITDSEGLATFEYLTVWDITGKNGTLKFQFAAGDRFEGLHIVSNVTKSNYTFVPSMSLKMKTQPARFISAYTNIYPHPTLRATSKVDRPFLLIDMRLTEIFNIDNSNVQFGDVTSNVVSNTLCYYDLENKFSHFG